MSNVVRMAIVGMALASVPAAPLQAQQPSESSGSKFAGYTTPRRGFNVVLLLGDMQGGDAQDNVPVAARKALADMKDFLPYKNYRLLDTQWIIGGAPGMPAITRLRGVDDQEYEFELRVSPSLNVRFVLRDPVDALAADRSPFPSKDTSKGELAALEISREIFQLEREKDDLQLQSSKKKKDVEVGTASPEDVKRIETQLRAIHGRIAELKQTAATSTVNAAKTATGRAVIDTSFQMTDGETVVVGTSKVRGGGKALIAVLTATTDRPKGATK